MRYCILFLLIIVLLPNCGDKKDKNEKNSKTITSFKIEKTETEKTTEETEPKKSSGIMKKIFKGKDYDEDFFKGGTKTIKAKQYGVYIVESGDYVWKIAEKFITGYLKKDDYNKTHIGSIAYAINLVNHDKLFGGVYDDISVGDKLLIPLHYEEYIEEYIKKTQYIKH